MRPRWAIAMAAVLVLAGCDAGTTDLPEHAVHTLEVGPAGPLTLVVGDTVWLTAYPRTEDGTLLQSVDVDWSTNASQVTDLSIDGYRAVVRATATGTARIHASSGDRTASVTVTVEDVPVDAVEVSPESLELVIGAEAQLEVALWAADGSSLEGRPVTWSSADHAIATVDSDGLVTGRGAGVVAIRAESEGVAGEAVVTVEEPETPAAYVVITSAWGSRMWVGSTRTMHARVLDASGGELHGREVTWSAEQEAVATVDALAGDVTARGEGTTRVLARTGGVTGYAAVKSYVHPVDGANLVFSSTLSDTSATSIRRSVATTWVDSLGVEHEAYIVAETGSLALDWSASGSGYQQVLVFGTYITEDSQAKRVAETEYGDSGTMKLWYDLSTGAHIYELRSSTTEGLTYWGRWSLPGELRVEQPIGTIEPETQPYYFTMLLP